MKEEIENIIERINNIINEIDILYLENIKGK